MKPSKAPNVSVALYDGDFQATFDCPGRCKQARFYVEPPEESDECSYRSSGGSCGWPIAQRLALLAVRERIDAELAKIEQDTEGQDV